MSALTSRPCVTPVPPAEGGALFLAVESAIIDLGRCPKIPRHSALKGGATLPCHTPTRAQPTAGVCGTAAYASRRFMTNLFQKHQNAKKWQAERIKS
jgi:hypothetical protein